MSTVYKKSPTNSFEQGHENAPSTPIEISRGRYWVAYTAVQNINKVPTKTIAQPENATLTRKEEVFSDALTAAPANPVSVSPELQTTAAQPANAEIDVQARPSQKTAAQPVNYAVGQSDRVLEAQKYLEDVLSGKA